MSKHDAQWHGSGYVGATDARQQLVLMIDLERCTGCRACEAACKLENRVGESMFRNRVYWVAPQSDGEHWEFLVAVCQQCARPACLRACGAAAIQKDAATGVVTIDHQRCTGCQECVLACPYGAMSFDARLHRADKCNLCADRRESGRGGPACAAACPDPPPRIALLVFQEQPIPGGRRKT